LRLRRFCHSDNVAVAPDPRFLFIGAPGWAATPLLLSDNSAILVYSVRLGQAVLERLLSGRCLFENPRFFTQDAYSDISGATPRDGGVRERVGRTLQFHGGGNNPRRSEDCQNRTPASLATSIEVHKLVHKLGPGLQAIPAPEKVTELSVSPLGEGPISPALTYARPSVYFEAGYAQRRVQVTSRKDHRSALCQEHFLIATSGKRSYEIHGRCGRIHGRCANGNVPL